MTKTEEKTICNHYPNHPESTLVLRQEDNASNNRRVSEWMLKPGEEKELELRHFCECCKKPVFAVRTIKKRKL